MADFRVQPKGVDMDSGVNLPQQPLQWFADELGRYQRSFEEANRVGLRPDPERVLSFSLHLSNSSAVPGASSRR